MKKITISTLGVCDGGDIELTGGKTIDAKYASSAGVYGSQAGLYADENASLGALRVPRFRSELFQMQSVI